MESSQLNDITLRPVTAGDREFLIAVFAAAREIELSMVPWSGEQKTAFVIHQLDAQVAHYTERFPDAEHDIVLQNGVPVGRLYIHRRADEIAILDLSVEPGHRGLGIGTHIISSIIGEAAASKRIVGVSVEPYNPSRHLFVKLGFTVVSDDGVNLRLEWHPS